jgi:hypothetical protein
LQSTHQDVPRKLLLCRSQARRSGRNLRTWRACRQRCQAHSGAYPANSCCVLLFISRDLFAEAPQRSERPWIARLAANCATKKQVTLRHKELKPFWKLLALTAALEYSPHCCFLFLNSLREWSKHSHRYVPKIKKARERLYPSRAKSELTKNAFGAPRYCPKILPTIITSSTSARRCLAQKSSQ